jgi:peptidoglycan/xylan/chitin deacetylase (PgdA/CDA1 family)
VPVHAPTRLACLVAATALLAGCGGGGSGRETAPAPLDPAIAPIPRAAPPSGPRDRRVPILMYHLVAQAPPGSAYPGLWVSPARFTAEIGALARAGYRAITLGDVWAAWHGRGGLPPRPLVVSFDDGYASQFTHARPVLDAADWPGVLNLEVKNVGLAGGLTRVQVADLVRDGWEVDAHTMTHPDLTTVGPGALHREVAGSRAWLRRVFRIPVNFFAYPAGRFDPTVQAAVRAAGFRGAQTTDRGAASPRDDPTSLPRIRVTPEMTPAALLATVRAATSR